jgi:predicted Zn-dependent protease
MKSFKSLFFSFLSLFSLIGLLRCATALVSGHFQLILSKFDPKTEVNMGMQAYDDVVKKGPIPKDPKVLALVPGGGGKKIAADVEDPVGGKITGLSSHPHYPWEFTVIDDPKTVNAFALPGG